MKRPFHNVSNVLKELIDGIVGTYFVLSDRIDASVRNIENCNKKFSSIRTKHFGGLCEFIESKWIISHL